MLSRGWSCILLLFSLPAVPCSTAAFGTTGFPFWGFGSGAQPAMESTTAIAGAVVDLVPNCRGLAGAAGSGLRPTTRPESLPGCAGHIVEGRQQFPRHPVFPSQDVADYQLELFFPG